MVKQKNIKTERAVISTYCPWCP